ncbi:MAG: mannose-6-phosphate isomerase, class I [Spirochaetaceae bacterium]|nr:MAG: mannose-6-phosphate isomerase, class I [Spirochaetaceae bacterium]
MGLFPLINTIQHYPWGSTTGIPSLLGIENSAGAPMAELWMGTHPGGPSRVVLGATTISLRDFLQSDPTTHLGPGIAERFGAELPFLFKVLAAERALSIQVHPSREQAQAGFAREETLGIAVDDPERNYKDRNHKPEVLCALTRFEGLAGFRDPAAIRADFDEPEFSVDAAEPLRDALVRDEQPAAVCRTFLHAMLSQKPRQTGELVSCALALASRRLDGRPVENESINAPDSMARFRWIQRLTVQFPGDIGVLSPLYLNHFALSPGQAVYLAAGTLHAYLHGVGVELMAASDNVLRGGLTGKHIDRDELLRVVDCGITTPTIIDGCAQQPLRSRTNTPVGFSVSYTTPAAEFRLERIVLEGDDPVQVVREPTAQIALCVGGRTRFLGNGEAHTISRGDALFISGTHTEYSLSGPGELFLASVPLEVLDGCPD